jgi:hypothetical protein
METGFSFLFFFSFFLNKKLFTSNGAAYTINFSLKD